MTNARAPIARWKKSLIAVALAAASGTSAAAINPSPAHADGAWGARYASCPANRWLVIRMYVTQSWVRVGYGPSIDAAAGAGGGTGRYNTLYPTGWRAVYTDRHAAWWMKWNSPGLVTSWRTDCVPYV
jgi:hypothetical protein